MTKKELQRIQEMPPLRRATHLYGVSGLGKLLGELTGRPVTKGRVNIWRVRRVPTQWHKPIEEVTDGQVLAEEFYHDSQGMARTYRYCVKARQANGISVKHPLV